ncbi:MAG: hypothetical protein ABSA34_00710 [Candidatus Goldiibacteriota bacterium]|jgi:hypothetical protein
MKKFKLFFAVAAAVILFALPVFALEDTNPEDLPSDADDATVAAEAEPNLPEVKVVQPEYFGLVDIRGDFTTVNMSSVNAKLASLTSVVAGGSVTDKMTIGYLISMDLGFKFFKGVPLTLGPRFDIIGCNTGKYSANDGAGNSLIYSLDATEIPFMLGGTYAFNFQEIPFEATLGIYAGAAYARASVNWLQTEVSPSNDYDLTAIYGGFGFAGEINGSFKYQFSETVAGGLNFGYRLSSVPSVTAQSTVNRNGTDTPIATQGQALQDSNNKNTSFDFSGFLIGADISMKY